MFRAKATAYIQFFAALSEQPDQQGKIVREDDLFPQPYQKPPQTHRRVFPAVLPVLQLPCDVRIADDGACNQLGEQGDIRAEVDEVLLCRDAAAIDVDGVAQALEGRGIFRPVTAFRLPMKKSAYLKTPSSPTLMTMDASSQRFFRFRERSMPRPQT